MKWSHTIFSTLVFNLAAPSFFHNILDLFSGRSLCPIRPPFNDQGQRLGRGHSKNFEVNLPFSSLASLRKCNLQVHRNQRWMTPAPVCLRQRHDIQHPQFNRGLQFGSLYWITVDTVSVVVLKVVAPLFSLPLCFVSDCFPNEEMWYW